MGQLVMQYGATLERFAGDGMMIFFNDPLEMADPAGTALGMALDMQQRFAGLQKQWHATRLFALHGHRHRPGRGDHWRHRLRREARLRCHRQRHQPRRAPMQRSPWRADISLAQQAALNAGATIPVREAGEVMLKGFAGPR
jgi:class 3 adenylate cyclase